MLRLTVGITILLVAACTHNRAVVQPDAAAAKTSGTAARSQAAAPVTAHPAAAAAPGTANSAPKRAVNADLLKQGYRTGLRHGQLVYCRTEQLTGSRFKSEVCMSEAQVLDEQKHARDTMTAPRRTQCLGPECIT